MENNNNNNNKERKASKAPSQRNNYANLFIPKISVSASVSTRSEALEFSRCHSRTFADFCIIDCSKQNRAEQTKGKNSPSCLLALQRRAPNEPLVGSLVSLLNFS